MIYYSLSFVLLFLDQATKIYMSSLLPLCQPGYCKSIEILPVFRFTILHNRGAAFSFLHDENGWQRYFLVAVSSVVSVFISVWLYRVSKHEKLLALALAFILGGALGNLVDRAMQGYVVDFIVVHYEQYYFPAFNIADSAVFIGAVLLILETVTKSEGKAHVT